MKTIQFSAVLSSGRSKRFIFLSLFALLASFALQAQTIRYVKHDATGANNGTSWTNAYTDLQVAMNAAAVGNEIWVAAGTYKPTQKPTGTTYTEPRLVTFYLNKNIKLYGGFAGTETQLSQRNYASNTTILSGDIGTVDSPWDNCYHVFITQNLTTAAVIDGFTIKDGDGRSNNVNVEMIYGSTTFHHYQGGGMNNYVSSPTLANLAFTNNWAYGESGSGFNGYGGGLYSNGSPVITNVTFTNNSASSSSNTGYGGGMYSEGSPVMTHVTFTNNSSGGAGSPSYGGGLYNAGGTAALTNLSFSGNSASQGGGMHNSYTNLTLTNASFYSNSAMEGGAIYNSASSPVLTNVTILTSTSGGLYNANNSSPTIKNSILWSTGNGNGSGSDYTVYNEAMFGPNQPIFYSSNIKGSGGSWAWVASYGTDGGNNNNIDCDPLFVSASNLSLQRGSPAISTGVNAYNASTTDLAGNTRIQDGSIDMGAYEFVCTLVTPIITVVSNDADNSIAAGTSVSFTARQTNGVTSTGCSNSFPSPTSPPTYQWKKNSSNVGTNSETYTDGTLANGDVIRVEMTDFMCGSSAVGTSNAITMVVTSCPPVTPSVTIASNDADNRITAGTSVTFSATPTNGGTTPTYQWKKNSANVGTNAATYTDAGLVNNDVITVVMTSSDACASPVTATSNAVTTIVCTSPTASITVTNNNGNYLLDLATNGTQFLWSNAATTEDITVSVAGTYSVTVTNAAGCTATTSAIAQPVSAQLYQLQVTDAQCGGAQPATLHLNMNTTRSCMDALMVKIQFDSTKVFFDNNLIIQKGAAIDSSGRVFYSIRRDTLFITVDLSTGCIQGDSGTNVLRLPFRLRPTFALPRATSAFNLIVLEERIVSGTTRDNRSQSFEVTGSLLGKIQVFRPNGNVVSGTVNPITLFAGDTCTLLNRAILVDSSSNAVVRLDSFRYVRFHRAPPALASPLIGGYDVFLLRNYLHAAQSLTARQKVAADVNNDGVISTLDITILRRRAIHFYTSFAEASAGRLTSDYQFTLQNSDTPNVCFRLPALAADCDTPSIQLNMITLGDINGDTDTTTLAGGIRENGSNGIAKLNKQLMVQLCRATRVANEWKIPVFADAVTRGLDLQLLNIPDTGVFRVESANPTAFEVSANGRGVGNNYYIIGYANNLQGISANDTLLYLYVKTANLSPLQLGSLKGYLDAQEVYTQKLVCTPTSDLYTNPYEVYPNPTTGAVQMTTQKPLSEPTTLRIYDMLGRCVKTQVLERGEIHFTIDMAALANSVYQFHFENQSIKVVKQ